MSRWIEGLAIKMGLIPTFPEFVQYVIDEYPNTDPHWMPQTRMLDACNLHYDKGSKYILLLKHRSIT